MVDYVSELTAWSLFKSDYRTVKKISSVQAKLAGHIAQMKDNRLTIRSTEW